LLRGLIVVASGFLFIFISGIPMRTLAGWTKGLSSEILYWGIGVGVVAATVADALFQGTVVPVIQSWLGGQARLSLLTGYLVTLVGALVLAAFVEISLYLALRLRRFRGLDPERIGLRLGLGFGLVFQVATGVLLLGSGFRLLFGEASDPTFPLLSALADSPLPQVILYLAAKVASRAVFPLVFGALGLLLGKARIDGLRYLGLAVVGASAFSWIVSVIQLSFSMADPLEAAATFHLGASAAVLVYYLVVFALTDRWLRTRAGVLDAAASVRLSQRAGSAAAPQGAASPASRADRAARKKRGR
jgi:hypothetical protein